MTAAPAINKSIVARFPPRSAHCIRLLHETDGARVVLAYSHAWVHGSQHDALADAKRLARNLRLPIRDENYAVAREPEGSA